MKKMLVEQYERIREISVHLTGCQFSFSFWIVGGFRIVFENVLQCYCLRWLIYNWVKDRLREFIWILQIYANIHRQ